MTALIKRFPQPNPNFNPKTNDITNRLETSAREAALLSLAVTGIMQLHQSDEAWPLRDAADRLASDLRALAEEILVNRNARALATSQCSH
jgi:hypothetical protein